jgi:hypothetical protein
MAWRHNRATVRDRPCSMRNHITLAVLLLVLAALVCDITMRSRPVHAQNPTTVYIDQVVNTASKTTAQITVKGTQIVGLSCGKEYCYVLSK